MVVEAKAKKGTESDKMHVEPSPPAKKEATNGKTKAPTTANTKNTNADNVTKQPDRSLNAAASNSSTKLLSNPLVGDKPEKLDPALFDENDLPELTDILYLQQLRIYSMSVCSLLFSSHSVALENQLLQLKNQKT
jgi:hypothetical protein